MRAGFKWIAVLILLVLLLVIAYALLRGVTGVVRVTSNQGAGEPDPMFAEPAERVTRPPEVSEEEAPVVSGDEDPSQNWVYETLTPVEQTAAELADAP